LKGRLTWGLRAVQDGSFHGVLLARGGWRGRANGNFDAVGFDCGGLL
jgi:hypothetical protein